jgi:hypothetical protein
MELTPPFLAGQQPAATTVPVSTEPVVPASTTVPEPTNPPTPAPPANEDEAEDRFAFFKALEKEMGLNLLETLPAEIQEKLDTNVTGVLPYLEAFAQAKLQSYEQELKQKFPKSWEAMEYEKRGGNPADYFSLPTMWSDVKVAKDNTAIQEQVIVASLKQKGNSEDEALELIELYKAKGDDTLYKKAQEHHKFLKETETAAKNEILRKQQELESQFHSRINAFSQDLVGIVKSGELEKFKVPQAEADKFVQHLQQNVIYDGQQDKFFMVQEIDSKNVKSTLDLAYFGYVKGDLKKMIEREAQTQAAKNLRLNLAADNNKHKGANMDGGESKMPTLTNAIKQSFNNK